MSCHHLLMIYDFIITTDQITLCNLKGFACDDKPKDNYHLTLQFPSPF